MLLKLMLAASVAATTPLSALRDPAFRVELAGALLDLGAAAADAKLARQVDAQLEKEKPAIRNDLIWSGQNGFLLEVRAFADMEGRVRMYTPPSVCGVGDAPVDALAHCYSRPAWRQGEQDNLRYSPKDSYMIWAQRTGGMFGISKGVHFGVIPGPWATLLRQEVATLSASDAVMSEMSRFHDAQVMQGMVEEAKRQMTGAQERATLSANYERLRQDREAVEQIDQKLRDTLERQAKAAAMLAKLRMLGNVLTLASTVGELYDQMGEPRGSDAPLVLTNNAAAQSWLTAYSERFDKEAQRFQQQREERVRSEQNVRIEIINVIYQQGAPRNLLN